jgi:hypothetical protein
MKALTLAPVPLDDVARVIARSDAAATNVVAGLIAEGLVVERGGVLHLP